MKQITPWGTVEKTTWAYIFATFIWCKGICILRIYPWVVDLNQGEIRRICKCHWAKCEGIVFIVTYWSMAGLFQCHYSSEASLLCSESHFLPTFRIPLIERAYLDKFLYFAVNRMFFCNQIYHKLAECEELHKLAQKVIITHCGKGLTFVSAHTIISDYTTLFLNFPQIKAKKLTPTNILYV